MTVRRPRGRRVAAGVAVTVAMVSTVALPACGGDDGGARRRTTETTLASDAGARSYVGLTKRVAIAKADAAGTPWRITREDDERFMVTQDYVPERLNFEIDDGTVTRATFG